MVGDIKERDETEGSFRGRGGKGGARRETGVVEGRKRIYYDREEELTGGIEAP